MFDVLRSLNFGSLARIFGLPSPLQADEPATKGYVDSIVEGLAWKDNVRVATQGNLNLASPGATIDGITMTSLDRVLVRSQTTTSQNGIYIWNGASTPMTRSLDANTAGELTNAVVSVDSGTSAGATFRQSAVGFVLDTDPVVWGPFGTTAGAATESSAGIAELATQSETDTGTDDARIVTPLKLANWSGRSRRMGQDIGDGSATSFTVTHNFNSRDVKVEVIRNSGNYDSVLTEVRRTSLNAVTIVVDSAPGVNALRVLVSL